MKRKIRLTESELTRLIKRVISEQNTPKNISLPVDCTKKTVDGFTGIADGFFTKHCATAQAGTAANAGAGTTPLDTYVSNMVDWRSSVINDKLAAFGGSKVNVSGAEGNKIVSTVYIEMKTPKEDPRMQNLIATPTYFCVTEGTNVAGSAQYYDLYFKKGSTEYNEFMAACKLQCQASQKKIQQVKLTKQ
jgi:hypothetical protein